MSYKYVKSKEHGKKLICHILGIMALLNDDFRASFVARLLKKEVSDLKSYF